jgi:hypothetical protein
VRVQRREKGGKESNNFLLENASGVKTNKKLKNQS